jgi:hypothetical protein
MDINDLIVGEVVEGQRGGRKFPDWIEAKYEQFPEMGVSGLNASFRKRRRKSQTRKEK